MGCFVGLNVVGKVGEVVGDKVVGENVVGKLGELDGTWVVG